MNGLTRKLLYMSIMPLLFIMSIMFTLTLFTTTYFLIPLVIFVMILRVSDRGKHFTGMNEWIKERFVGMFPDIYRKGVMPNSRTLMICIPAILAMLLNIPLSNI